LSINKGNFLDVIEVDAASRTGVDGIREIIDSVMYSPNNARFKVYIIDEVHMLSNAAFNALLKTLEEPPQNVKFIFATTEIKKNSCNYNFKMSKIWSSKSRLKYSNISFM